MKGNRKLAHIMMVITVIIWGLEYVCAKTALEELSPLVLINFKYVVAFFFMLVIKIKMDPHHWIQKKDIGLFILCSVTGEILYYYCEYSAMDYLTVSVITIILAFVPALSVITERVIFKKHPNKAMIAAMLVCIAGVGLVIGVDFGQLVHGKAIGYIFCFGAVFFWNMYNFITSGLGDRYKSVTLTFNQLTCTLLLTAPYTLMNLPSLSVMTQPSMITSILYLGVVSGGIGFLFLVYSLSVLGPTPNAVYSNFLPVTSTLFAWLFLGESISWLQILGGIIVISAGYIVIREKGKLEEQYSD